MTACFSLLLSPSNCRFTLPLVQFQKKPKFYDRLFAEIFLYFYQYDHDNEWVAIVIYRRRSIETPAARQYQELMQHRVRRIYLDELGEAAQQYIGIGIVQLVVETKKKTGDKARQLISKARLELADAIIQQQVIELIETIVLYKFPNLSREEIEAMLGLSEIKQTRVYQEAREEGKLDAKLNMVFKLQQRGFSLEEIAELLELEVETIRLAS